MFDKFVGFDWSGGNAEKNWEKHHVSVAECEQTFFNKPLVLAPDDKHSATEVRSFLLGKTDAGRKLFVAFTVRRNLIRVISARDMSRKEREVYAEKTKKVSEI